MHPPCLLTGWDSTGQPTIPRNFRYLCPLFIEYRLEGPNALPSTRLRDPLLIELSTEACNLIVSHQLLFKRFGISLSPINQKTIAVREVPECFDTSKYCYDEFRMRSRVQSLLDEILQNTSNQVYKRGNLPVTLQNAIAMEACHGVYNLSQILFHHPCNIQAYPNLAYVYSSNINIKYQHLSLSLITVLYITLYNIYVYISKHFRSYKIW